MEETAIPAAKAKTKMLTAGNDLIYKMITTYRYLTIIFIFCLPPFSALAQNLEKNINIPPAQTAAPASATAIKPANPAQDAGNPVPTAASDVQQPAAQPIGPEAKPAPANQPGNMPQVTPQLQRRLPGQPAGYAAPGLPNTPSLVHTPGSDLNITNPPQVSFPSTIGRITRGSVSLNFDDADIYSVILTVFGEILKVNYIIDPKVKGRVTFRSIAPVPQENVLPLMEVILRLNGVAIVEENSLYRIIPITDLAREPAAINLGRNAEKVQIRGKALLQVVPIEYMQSSDIVKLIGPFVSTSAVIVDVPKSNNIIIADTDANVKRLLQLISIFDSPQPKKKGPQVFVHHVQNTKAKDITAVLQQIFLGAKAGDKSDKRAVSVSSSGQTSSPADRNAPQVPAPMQALQSPGQPGEASGVVSDLVKIYADEILNAIIILGTPEDYQIIKDTIAKLDIVPRQVLLEGAIAQIQLTDKMSLGLAWSLNTNLFGLSSVTIGLNPSQLSSDTSTTSGLSLIGIDSGNSVRAVINALASKSKAKLLASPHIMVSDNREARIQVGQQVPIVTSESYGGTAVSTVPIRTIQYKDIGIILKVKPQINDSGLVSLELSQEISTYSKDTFYANEVQIILNKTEASTNLVVQDGQTIVIGGLIREDDSKSRQGIPFLSNIPILGYLFGNTDNEALRTEIVILLTPHVVKNQRDARSATDKFVDKMTDEQVAKEMKKGIQVKEEESK
jgi:general secretion pathway protein D